MKSLFIAIMIISVLGLAGCNNTVNVKQLDLAYEACADHGGLKYYRALWDQNFGTAFCEDGAMFLEPRIEP